MGNVICKRPEVSVVIPALNEERNIEAAVRSAKTATNCEVIVVDGGSTDATSRLARRAGAKVISSPRGRGVQMNKGASQARGDILLFLHADSQLPHEWHEHVHRALSPTPSPDSLSHASPKPPPQQQRVYRGWGSFKTIQIDTDQISSFIIGEGVKLRTTLFHRPYGDQGIFVTKQEFKKSGGYPDWPLLEDVALVGQLKRNHGPPSIVPLPMPTSGRRWHALGLVQTTLINQAILVGYAVGVDVYKLAALYNYRSRSSAKRKPSSLPP